MLKTLRIMAAIVVGISLAGGVLAQGPSTRMDYAFAYDSAQKVTVMFGGWSGTTHLDDTWFWNGSTWSAYTPAHSPSARLHQCGCFDSDRNEFIMFGGMDASWNQLKDVWIFNGTDWSEETPGATIGKADGELAYDSNRKVSVLFVSDVWGTPFVETWERSGTTWTQKSPATSPKPRADTGLVFDSNRNVCVLFAGLGKEDTSFLQLNDTWEYDGTNWTKKTPTNSPSARCGAAMCYDSKRNVTILFGGQLSDGTVTNETWEYNGTTWVQASLAQSPPARWVAFMAYDSDRQRCVLFGGEKEEGGNWIALGDTWEYDGTNWVEGGSQPTPEVDWCNLQWPPNAQADVGSTVTVYGWVYEAGVTEGDGQGAGIDSEAGVGDDGTSPASHLSWQWFSGVYNGDKDGLVPGDKANDEYMSDIIAPAVAGKYDYGFRFRLNGGAWKYGDLDGSDNGYSPDQAGVLTVQGGPTPTPTPTPTPPPDEVDWCNLQWPPDAQVDIGSTFTVYGWVYEPGVTVGDGQGAGIEAQAGLGDYGTSPTSDTSWSWMPTTYNGDKDGLIPGDKANDEYMAGLAPQAAGKYSYCFRYRIEKGPWRYGDLDGSDNGFQNDQMGVLTVMPSATDVIERLLGRVAPGDLDANNDGKVDVADLIYILKGQ